MKKIMSTILAVVMILGAMLSMTGCGGNSSDSDMAGVKERGKLVVGITDFAPMDYKNKKGEWVGFDADMAKAFAESLGVEAEFVEIDWDNKELELENGSIDVVWNGMTLTDAVKEAMETANPYCDNAQVVVVNKDKADSIKTADDAKSLAFAVEAGSAGADAAKEAGFETTDFQTQANAVMEVATGTAEACVIDSLMAGAMVGEGTSYPDLVCTDVKLTSEQYGAGFRKGSDLAEELNSFQKTSYEDGTMEKLAKKYGVQNALIAQE